MVLPKYFMKLSGKEQKSFVDNLRIAFDKIDKIRYPYIYENIQEDESRLALVERIVNEYYARSLQPSVEQVFNKIEISLGD